MLMRLFSGPKHEVLLIHMPTLMEMGLVAKEKNVQKFRIVLDVFVYPLARILASGLVFLGLRLKTLHNVRE